MPCGGEKNEVLHGMRGHSESRASSNPRKKLYFWAVYDLLLCPSIRSRSIRVLTPNKDRHLYVCLSPLFFLSTSTFIQTPNSRLVQLCTSGSRQESQIVTLCWNPNLEQTLQTPGAADRSHDLNLYSATSTLSSWGWHCHVAGANALAGFYLASLSLQSHLNRKPQGLSVALSHHGSYQGFVTRWSKGGGQRRGVHVQYAFLLLHKKYEIINWKKLEKN